MSSVATIHCSEHHLSLIMVFCLQYINWNFTPQDSYTSYTSAYNISDKIGLTHIRNENKLSSPESVCVRVIKREVRIKSELL